MSKNKTTGYKNDIQNTTLANIPALGNLVLSMSETSKGTLMLKGGGGVEYTTQDGHTYKPTAKVQLFVSKSKRWPEDQRAKVKSEYRPVFLRDGLPESTALLRDESKASERFGSAGGVVQLRCDVKGTIAGLPVHGTVVLSFRGSRDWPEARPAAPAASPASER